MNKWKHKNKFKYEKYGADVFDEQFTTRGNANKKISKSLKKMRIKTQNTVIYRCNN